jgi:hypothetical protein
MPEDSAEETALFRYRVIAEALSERLTPAERGLLVRELAAHTHAGPDRSRREVQPRHAGPLDSRLSRIGAAGAATTAALGRGRGA